MPFKKIFSSVTLSLVLFSCTHVPKDSARNPSAASEIFFTTNLDRPTNLTMSLSDVNSGSITTVFLALNKINSTLPDGQKVKFWLLVPKKFQPDDNEDPQKTVQAIEKKIKETLRVSAMPPEWKLLPMSYHRYAWMQDIGETIWIQKDGKWEEAFLDLNKSNTKNMPKDAYPSEREMEEIGYENSDFAIMALQKVFSGFKKNHFRMPPYKITDKNADSTGNQGGNLETLPGNIPLVGNTAPPEMLSFIKSTTGLDPVVIDTSFLRVGHVDEITAIIPSNHSCGFSLMIADPLWGQLLNKDKKSYTKVKGDSVKESLDYFSKSGQFRDDDGIDAFDFTRKLRRYKKSEVENTLPDIEDYPFLNDWYVYKALKATQSIQQSGKKIADVLKAKGVCADLQIIPVPVGIDFHAELDYFQADKKDIERGFFFMSTPTPNLVVIQNHLIMSDMTNVPDDYSTKLKPATLQQLAKAGYTTDRIHFVDASSYHAGMGSIHCGTFTVRRPKKMEQR